VIEGTDPEMAPSDLGWHYRYSVWLYSTMDELAKLQEDPAFEDAEDLGDYVETIHTLLTFAPRTRDDIDRAARESVYG
jgi:hypothetical protein